MEEIFGDGGLDDHVRWKNEGFGVRWSINMRQPSELILLGSVV